MKMRNTLGANSLATVAAVLFFASCGGQQQRQMPSAVFETMKVNTQTIQINNKYSATIRGRQDIDVYPQVGGTLQKLCVTEGQTVKKGQTLFVIDQVPYQAALNTAEAALKAAQAQEATAQLSYESRKKLYDEQVVSQFDMQTAQNALLTAQAQVAQAKAQVVNARNSLSYTVVKSPSDGVVGILPYRQGALVSANMPQPLTTVSDNSQMYVYSSMNETQLLKMTRQYGCLDTAIAQMPAVSLKLADGTIYSEQGRVESVSGVVDRNTGSVQLRASFANPSKLLHSGSTGSVVIPAILENVIVIPTQATVQTQDKFKVYKVDSEGIAHTQLIEVSEKEGANEYIVIEGLNPGDEIVSLGAGMVRDGQDVKKLGQADANKPESK